MKGLGAGGGGAGVQVGPTVHLWLPSPLHSWPHLALTAALTCRYLFPHFPVSKLGIHKPSTFSKSPHLISSVCAIQMPFKSPLFPTGHASPSRKHAFVHSHLGSCFPFAPLFKQFMEHLLFVGPEDKSWNPSGLEGRANARTPRRRCCTT